MKCDGCNLNDLGPHNQDFLLSLRCPVSSFQTAIGANATTVLGIPIEFRHVSWR